MKIKYFKDGLRDLSEWVEVEAIGDAGYYILEGKVLRAVPLDCVPMHYQENALDVPPNVRDYVDNNIGDFNEVDYTLVDMFRTVH